MNPTPQKQTQTKSILLLATLLALPLGCHSSPQTGPPGSTTADGLVIRPNQIPVAVTAAFDAEHPYAKITQAALESDQNGPHQYTLQYTRPDASTGKATYSPSGQLLHDNQ